MRTILQLYLCINIWWRYFRN